mgnify:CR=1 FL=1
MTAIKEFFKKETVLCVAGAAALLSVFFVPVNTGYLEYINFRVLILLYCLMAVVQGFKDIGVFDTMSASLLKRAHDQRTVALLLVLTCMALSMFITNDVTLVTMVPFTIMTFERLGCVGKDLINCLVMETVAANLGSMLTPLGNPQNLYLYAKYGYTMPDFIKLMLPLFILSLLLIVLLTFFSMGKGSSNVPAVKCDFDGGQSQATKENANITVGQAQLQASISTSYKNNEKTKEMKLLIFLLLFVLCILTVAKVFNEYVLFVGITAAMLITDRKALRNVDYLLLLTFVFFFIFSGNMGKLTAVSNLIEQLIKGRALLISIVVSQIISNVPAAVLLSNFTANGRALILGTNIGGLGTLIASMASLITYKLYAAQSFAETGKFVRRFTLINLALLVILYLAVVVVFQ